MLQFIAIKVIHSRGLFTLPDTNSDWDTKSDGYIMASSDRTYVGMGPVPGLIQCQSIGTGSVPI